MILHVSSLKPWSVRDREVLLNRARRRVLETRPLSDVYWWRMERKSPRKARLARRALEYRQVQEVFWRYLDLRANPRSRAKDPTPDGRRNTVRRG